MIVPSLGPPVDEVWSTLLDLSEGVEAAWTVVGGQMVLLLALEHGVVPPQISQDGDVLVDVRADQSAIGEMVDALEHAGFALESISADNVAHRFVREAALGVRVVFDVLAPEGLGPRANLTTRRPGKTIEVPGGTQALERTERVPVDLGGRIGTIPRPSLLGALVAKGAACGLPGNTDRHHRDLALLCSLVTDPFSMSEQLTKKDRTRLRLGSALNNHDHAAWRLLDSGPRTDGQNIYALLTRIAVEPHRET